MCGRLDKSHYRPGAALQTHVKPLPADRQALLDPKVSDSKEYQAWREEENIPNSSGYIEGWDDKVHFPQELQDKCPEVRWTNIVCKLGEVRISNPRLPHGSTGPATKVRCTMLPWFVRVHQDDMATMEVPKMGSYDEIRHAYNNLIPAPRSPSGHANRFGSVHWAFPGDQRPHVEHAIGRAIICQERWDSLEVLEALHDFLGEGFTREKWVAQRDAHRKQIRQWALDAWEETK